MYAPDPDNVYKLVLDFRYGSEPYFYTDYDFSAENILLPECGYIITPDFSIIYDEAVVDDGTINGNNDAHILLLNFIIDYLATQVKDFVALSYIFSSQSSLSSYQSENLSILIPEVDLADIDKKQFRVGRRVHTSREFVKNEAGDAYFKSLQATIKFGRELGIPEFDPGSGESGGSRKYPLQPILGYNPFQFTNCTQFYSDQFTMAIGSVWETSFTSGWYPSRGFALVPIKHTYPENRYYPPYGWRHIIYLNPINPEQEPPSTQPLGVEYALLGIPQNRIEYLKSVGLVADVPDRFYLLRAENTRNVGGMVMDDASGREIQGLDRKYTTYCSGWSYYVDVLFEYEPLLKDLLSHKIRWYKILYIPLAADIFDAKYFSNSPYMCESWKGASDYDRYGVVAYLIFNDPLALVELGFPSDKVEYYKGLFLSAEEKFLTEMEKAFYDKNHPKHWFVDNANWKIYFRGTPYFDLDWLNDPTPVPPNPFSPEVPTPTPPTQPSPGTFYTSAPFEVQNGQVYVSGTFANVSIAANGEIIITSIFSGRRQLSDVARVQNYSGSSIPSSNPLAKAAISGGKPVYCGEYFVTAYNLVKTSANSIGVSSTFSTNLLVRIMGNMYKDSNGNVRIKNSPSFSLMPLRIYSPGGADVTLTVTTVPVSILVL